VKKYANIAQVITDAMRAYITDVKEGRFPEDDHCYHMLSSEAEKFPELTKEFE